jgi:hypothetical protein
MSKETKMYTVNHDVLFNTWITSIQSFKKQLTANWPDEMKTASDAFIDAQSEFARKAYKSTMDFQAGFNKAFTSGISK